MYLYVWFMIYSVTGGAVRAPLPVTNVAPAAGAERSVAAVPIRARPIWLAAQAKLLDQRSVAADVLAGQVLQ